MNGKELALEIRKILLIENNLSETQAAKLAGMSQQNFSAKLKAGTLRYCEVTNLLEKLGYEIRWNKKNPVETSSKSTDKNEGFILINIATGERRYNGKDKFISRLAAEQYKSAHLLDDKWIITSSVQLRHAISETLKKENK